MPHLADTSAWMGSQKDPGLARSFSSLVSGGEIWTCDMVKLELLAMTRNGAEFDRRRLELDAPRQCPITATEWARAMAVYRELAHQGGGHQRSVKHPDLLIAAAAESAGVPVLHYDEDFDRIAKITGQPAEWIAPRGSL